jgi:predicted HicB family RNase H-like nuclease
MHKIIRVPEDVHRELKASAAREVKTLFAYADELLRRALTAKVVKK